MGMYTLCWEILITKSSCSFIICSWIILNNLLTFFHSLKQNYSEKPNEENETHEINKDSKLNSREKEHSESIYD